ncbi:alpha/beta hydrolase [Streptomyces sp. NPDC101393]|uniref:alpha/beta hydrolase n=1 Tax=Streptomyces sp. NPDC101393 TaxID=3366141 RepID=UPI003800A189
MTLTNADPQPPPQALSAGVRHITLDGAGITLSALLSEPEEGPPRAVVVAVHGGGMSAGYFDGQAHPDLSLLVLGARLGYTVLAVDRPGYGRSAAQLPEGQTLAEQSATLRAALTDFAASYRTGAGLFLLAHSYGGKLVMVAAADAPPPSLLGLDVSGCGHRYAVEPSDVAAHLRPSDTDGGAAAASPLSQSSERMRYWGPLHLYPPGTFRSVGPMVSAVPVREPAEAARWPQLVGALLPRIQVPVRLTFAEHEAWWRHDDASLADLATQLSGTSRVVIDRQPLAGHNISLGWAARSYHLRALAFLEDCLAAGRKQGPAA